MHTDTGMPSPNLGIAAIETRYKGYHFRSRLEARWAVFFDALGLTWRYEPEGYKTPLGYYLPDFFLSCGNGSRGPWVEVKGVAPTREEIGKLAAVCDATCAYGHLVSGPPEFEDVCTPSWNTTHIRIHKEGFRDGDEDCRPFTDNDWLWYGWERRIGFAGLEEHEQQQRRTEVWNAAVVAALSARFEHGHTPILPLWTYLTTVELRGAWAAHTDEILHLVKDSSRLDQLCRDLSLPEVSTRRINYGGYGT